MKNCQISSARLQPAEESRSDASLPPVLRCACGLACRSVFWCPGEPKWKLGTDVFLIDYALTCFAGALPPESATGERDSGRSVERLSFSSSPIGGPESRR